MSKVYEWYNSLSKQIRDSIGVTTALVSIISSVLSIIGISLGSNGTINIWIRIFIVLTVYFLIFIISYGVIRKIFKNQITLNIRQTSVSIREGDIFNAKGYKVIGCDTHFDTRIDDVVITKNSLHGQLFLKYGRIDEIKVEIEKEANRLGLSKNKDGLYDFPLGTIIRYDSSIDDQTYLMLSLTELDENYEAHTNMAKYELTLMKMWKEISRVYASHDIALPLLGAGIVRFDDGPKYKDALLRCILCTLNSSAVSFNSQVEIVLYDNDNDIPLYEYKDLFRTIPRR